MKHGLAVTVSVSSIVICLMKHLVPFYYTLSMLVGELLVHCVLDMYTCEDIWYEMEFAEKLVH
jgi:hypothetical protein